MVQANNLLRRNLNKDHHEIGNERVILIVLIISTCQNVRADPYIPVHTNSMLALLPTGKKVIPMTSIFWLHTVYILFYGGNLMQ